jgi:hypothetical protein
VTTRHQIRWFVREFNQRDGYPPPPAPDRRRRRARDVHRLVSRLGDAGGGIHKKPTRFCGPHVDDGQPQQLDQGIITGNGHGFRHLPELVIQVALGGSGGLREVQAVSGDRSLGVRGGVVADDSSSFGYLGQRLVDRDRLVWAWANSVYRTVGTGSKSYTERKRDRLELDQGRDAEDYVRAGYSVRTDGGQYATDAALIFGV